MCLIIAKRADKRQLRYKELLWSYITKLAGDKGFESILVFKFRIYIAMFIFAIATAMWLNN